MKPEYEIQSRWNEPGWRWERNWTLTSLKRAREVLAEDIIKFPGELHRIVKVTRRVVTK